MKNVLKDLAFNVSSIVCMVSAIEMMLNGALGKLNLLMIVLFIIGWEAFKESTKAFVQDCEALAKENDELEFMGETMEVEM